MKDFRRDSIRLDNSGYLSTEQKRKALDALRDGKSIARVSRDSGIHIESIKRWAKELAN
jgi:transposase-like protein